MFEEINTFIPEPIYLFGSNTEGTMIVRSDYSTVDVDETITNAIKLCGEPLYWIDLQSHIRAALRSKGVCYDNHTWKKAVNDRNIPHLNWIKHKKKKRQLLALTNGTTNVPVVSNGPNVSMIGTTKQQKTIDTFLNVLKEATDEST